MAIASSYLLAANSSRETSDIFSPLSEEMLPCFKILGRAIGVGKLALLLRLMGQKETHWKEIKRIYLLALITFKINLV
jgi:hypothetical protein